MPTLKECKENMNLYRVIIGAWAIIADKSRIGSNYGLFLNINILDEEKTPASWMKKTICLPILDSLSFLYTFSSSAE